MVDVQTVDGNSFPHDAVLVPRDGDWVVGVVFPQYDTMKTTHFPRENVSAVIGDAVPAPLTEFRPMLLLYGDVSDDQRAQVGSVAEQLV